jgi:hypothetical protein
MVQYSSRIAAQRQNNFGQGKIGPELVPEPEGWHWHVPPVGTAKE